MVNYIKNQHDVETRDTPIKNIIIYYFPEVDMIVLSNHSNMCRRYNYCLNVTNSQIMATLNYYLFKLDSGNKASSDYVVYKKLFEIR